MKPVGGGRKIVGEAVLVMAASVPVEITRRDDGILFQWDRNGDETLVGARAMRLACPCIS